MAEFGPDIADAVFAACQAGAAEAAGALGRTFDAVFELTPRAPVEHLPSEAPAAWRGPGLLLVVGVGALGAAVVLPAHDDLVPSWAVAPDATGRAKLTTLAQEMGMLLLPEEFMPEQFEAGHSTEISAALARAALASTARRVDLELKAGGGSSVISLVWPLQDPLAALKPAPEPAAPTAEPAPVAAAPPPATPTVPVVTAPVPPAAPEPPRAAPVAPQPAASPPAPPPAASPPAPPRPRTLPAYAQSLLRIRVPVAVSLAHTRMAVQRIVDLGPGAIIQFNKGCDEPLELEINGRVIARGECVKVGDKFGFRVAALALPGEEFHALGKPAASGPARPGSAA
jgi:flagellar motor switch/type III secretory pathway protein FliN